MAAFEKIIHAQHLRFTLSKGEFAADMPRFSRLHQSLSTFIRQVLRKVPDGIPGFGRPVGVVVNYSPDRAIKFDFSGYALELLPQAHSFCVLHTRCVSLWLAERK
jgi:hypothetical protein